MLSLEGVTAGAKIRGRGPVAVEVVRAEGLDRTPSMSFIAARTGRARSFSSGTMNPAWSC